MKRSEINSELIWAKKMLAEYRFPLPRFAYWGIDEWRENSALAGEVFKTQLGWDITDFGMGDFKKIGAVLFTIRNGLVYDPGTGSPYAEKLILLHAGQRLPNHYHAAKTEDIINRGGGAFYMKLYNKLPDGGVDSVSDVETCSDGIYKTVRAGEPFLVNAGDSVRLRPYTYHIFGATDSDVIVGEVSSVNDDHTDNYFAEKTARFPEITEDTAPIHPLVCDYEKLFAK